MLEFAQGIENTNLSRTIRELLWVVPWVQTVHILAIAVVLSSIFMIDMRILNLNGTTQTMVQTARRFVPWLWWGLVVLTLSGTILIIGEPVRSLVNPAFWLKMTLLLIAIISTVAFQLTLRRDAGFWEKPHRAGTLTRALAVGSLLVWCGIAVAGRWIAYAY